MTHKLHVKDSNGDYMIVGWFDDFDGPNEFAALSNFYKGRPIFLPGVEEEFATGEHAFAAMKAYRGMKTRDYYAIAEAESPGYAKALGQSCRLRPDWEAVKYDVMMAVLRFKFTLDREEGDILLRTGNAVLIEGTYWEDRVWGVDLGGSLSPLVAPGRNWLGTMLMARRAELNAEMLYGIEHPAGMFNAYFASKS